LITLRRFLSLSYVFRIIREIVLYFFIFVIILIVIFIIVLVIIFIIGVVILFFILIIVLRIFIVVLFRFALRYFIRFGLFRLFLHFLIFSAGSELASGFLLYGRRHISVIVILVIKRNVIFIIEVIQFLIPVNQFDRKHDHKDKKQEKHTA